MCVLILWGRMQNPSLFWSLSILPAAFLADGGATLFYRFVTGQEWLKGHRNHAYQHAALRWGHLRVVCAFLTVNVVFVLPLAWYAKSQPQWGVALFLAALAVLAGAAYWNGAGTPSSKEALKAPMTDRTGNLAKSILTRLRRRHGFAVMLADGSLCLFAALTAIFLKYEFLIPGMVSGLLIYFVLAWLVSKLLVFRLFAIHRSMWRHVSLPELRRLLQANITGSGLAAAILFSIFGSGVPRSLLVLDLLVSIVYMSGARFLVRMASEMNPMTPSAENRSRRALIYGAGKSGVALLRETRQNQALGILISGFVDDDPAKVGTYVHGVPVLGTGAQLKELSVHYPVDQVLVSITQATPDEMAAIFNACTVAGLACKILPGIAEFAAGRALAHQVRNISIEDLLGRHSVTLDLHAIAGRIEGKTVMVTGAAGSIGSELCRQIARHRPKLIVGYDAAETPLFFVDGEFRNRLEPAPFQPVIGSVQDSKRLTEVMEQYRPSVVYHAAAYKHVPMMELNPYEAVANNVFGTESVLKCAMEAGVSSFIMISTDKAVNPTNIMGTTKRIAELLVNAFSSKSMSCVSVRFGNVLGSNGSVVPIFKQQIAAGGPVTVTHPEMRRYFMTIPEAAQLVLQASTIGKSGEILVLEMGEPVKIVDLAYNMIRLAGLKPHEDIEVQFSGIRPGEKLYEEINLDTESMLPTSHKSVCIFQGPAWGKLEMEEQLAKIRAAWNKRDTPELLRLMREAVPEYNLNRVLLEPKQVEEEAPLEFTLLGGIDRELPADLLELNDEYIRIEVDEDLRVDSAVSVAWQQDIFLGEVWRVGESNGRYVAQIKVIYRLPGARGKVRVDGRPLEASVR
jgi:FlaA1/EpsC-like NDP-sugar epimerase